MDRAAGEVVDHPITGGGFAWAYWRPPASRRLLCDFHFLTSLPLLILLGFLLIFEGCLYIVIRLAGRFVENLWRPPRVRRHLHKVSDIETFEEYRKWAEEMDILTGRERWKLTPSSAGDLEGKVGERSWGAKKKRASQAGAHVSGYDTKLVRLKVHQLRDAMASGSLESVIDVVHSCLVTQMLGTLRPELYSFTYAGTKKINEELQEEVIRALGMITRSLQTDSTILDKHPSLVPILKRLPKEFGPSALILSGGAMLGLHHLGLTQILAERDMIPMIISGTSAGSILAAIVASKTRDELLSFMRGDECFRIMKDPFMPPTIRERLRNYFKHGHLMDMDKWLQDAHRLFGGLTFLDAFRRTGRILNISMTRAGSVKHPVTLNYLNAPHVTLFSATIASAAFPFLASPLHLIEKDPHSHQLRPSIKFNQMYFHDGSLQGDVPATEIKYRWGVPFAVVSQVNLHVFPFLELRAHGTAGLPVRGWGSASVWRGGFLFAAAELALKEHLRFLLRTVALLEIAPAIRGIDMAHVALQDYGGDLNIYPKRVYWEHRYMMRNVPRHIYEWYVTTGKKMLFPRLTVFMTRFRIERALRDMASALLTSGVANRKSLERSSVQAVCSILGADPAVAASISDTAFGEEEEGTSSVLSSGYESSEEKT